MNQENKSRIDRLKIFLEEDPTESFTRYALAMEYAKVARYTEALEEFNTLVKNDPSYVATYFQMGKVYEQQGQTDAAEHTYNTGMKAALEAGDKKTRDELFEAISLLKSS